MFGITEHSLMLRTKRAEVLASNIANSDTPGFMAKDFDFANALKQTMASLNQNDNNQSNNQIDPLKQIDLQYRIPTQPSQDGNTVDPQLENAQFSENSMRYMTSLRLLDDRIKGMQLAIRGQ